MIDGRPRGLAEFNLSIDTETPQAGGEGGAIMMNGGGHGGGSKKRGRAVEWWRGMKEVDVQGIQCTGCGHRVRDTKCVVYNSAGEWGAYGS